MSRARDLSKLGNPNVIKADENSVGFGTQVAGNHANADSSLISAGIITATAYYGDGSNLEGVASAGLGTAVDDTKDSIGQNIYFTNQELSINENTTVNAPDTSSIAYTQYQQVTVESGSELIIADGDSFIPDVLGIGTALQASTAGAGNGLFGTLYVDNIENVAGRGGPNFPLGITVAGVSTLSGNVSIGGTLTYEDVTNVDSIGVVTARSGIDITSGGLDITAGGATVTAGGITVGSGGINVTGNSTLGGNLNINGPDANNYITLKNTTPSDASNSRSSKIIFQGTRSGGEVSDLVHLAGQHDGGNDNDWGAFRVLVNNGSGVTERFGIGQGGEVRINASIGSAGQVLTSAGGGSPAVWAEAGGGAWEVVNDISMGADYGSHEMNITGFTTSYTKYVVNFNNLNYVGGSGKKLFVRFYLDGTLYTTGTMAWGSVRNDFTATGMHKSGTYNTSFWPLMAEDSQINWCGEIHIPMNMNPATNPMAPYAIVSPISSNDWFGSGGCKTGASVGSQITGIKLYNGTDTTNFGLSGRVTTYGLKYS